MARTRQKQLLGKLLLEALWSALSGIPSPTLVCSLSAGGVWSPPFAPGQAAPDLGG